MASAGRPTGERPARQTGSSECLAAPSGEPGRQVRNGGGEVGAQALAGCVSVLPSYPRGPRRQISLSTCLPPQMKEGVGARQWLARSYYGFNRRTWTSRYRQIYNSIQSVRHTQGRCKQGSGPESGCAKWARREALAAPRALPARLLHGGREEAPRRDRGATYQPGSGAEGLGLRRRRGARRRAHPIFSPPAALRSLKIVFPGAGQAMILGRARAREAPQRVLGPG